jgi:hypothetical protein
VTIGRNAPCRGDMKAQISEKWNKSIFRVRWTGIGDGE